MVLSYSGDLGIADYAINDKDYAINDKDLGIADYAINDSSRSGLVSSSELMVLQIPFQSLNCCSAMSGLMKLACLNS